MKISGLSAFPITPADHGGRIDVPALRALLAPLVSAGVDTIGLLGSTGSYPYLTRAERRRATDAAIEEAVGRTPILVGIGALRTDETLALAQDAKAAGATAGLLAPVSYTPLNDDEVFQHFETIARDSNLPLVIYDNPGTTHFTFSTVLIGRLSRLPGVIAVKTAAPERTSVASHLSTLREATPRDFSIGYSADWNCIEGLIAGADAWYSVVAGLFPKICVAAVQAAQAGEIGEAQRLNAQLQPLWMLFKEFSSLRVIYAIASQRGLCRTAPPRPILPLDEAAQRRVAETISALDLH